MRTKRMNRKLCFWNCPAFLPPWPSRADRHRRALQQPSPLAGVPVRRGLLALSLALPATALAGPAGEQVSAGLASVSRPDSVTTVINQQSQKAVIDWREFSIGRQELVRFQQPGTGSIALNRVLGSDPSRILGNLSANGQVFLVNPNGVLFGPDSRVSVHGLLATTHEIGNEEFLAGRYTFGAEENPYAGGGVVNEGFLAAGPGGYIVLAGDYAENSGVIEARLGAVELAAGSRLTLDLEGDELIGLAVDEASLASRAGVANLGAIAADGGRVVMTAKVASELAASVVNNEGLIEARSLGELNGEIILDGAAAGVVANSGTLDASGLAGGETGGSVRMLGERVGLLDQGLVDVSGANGGGTVLIGGDFQGGNPQIENARATFLGQEAQIRADAIENGDGGQVIAWADGTTRAYGSISARGGAKGGDGGFVEVSGREYLDFQGRVNTSAPLGHSGTLLLDPTDITIDGTNNPPSGTYTTGTDLGGGVFDGFTSGVFNGESNSLTTIGWGYLNGLLSSNNVIVQTSSTGGGTGNITFAEAGVSAGGSNSLSFLAENNITVDAPITFTSSGGLVMVAGWHPASGYTAPTATNTAGSLAINAAVTSNAGSPFTLLAKDALTISNTQVNTGGGMTLSATNIGISATASPVGVFAGGSQAVTATGNLTLSGGTASGANAILQGGGQNISAGAVFIDGGSALDTEAVIVADGGDQIVGAGSIEIFGGSGQGAHASIGTIGDVAQSITVDTGGILISGGSGVGAFADIYHDAGSTGQAITVNSGGSIAISGGSASDGGGAGIFSDSSGSQAIVFAAGGSLSLTGGTVGINNWAGISSSAGGALSISGSPDITLTGGTSGTAAMDEEGNSAELGDGNVTIDATDLLLQGGAGPFAGAYIGGGSVGMESSISLNVTGVTTLTGGTGTKAHAAIGTDLGDAIIDLTSSGNVTLSGNGGAGGLALIGVLAGEAAVTINSTSLLSASSAGIGSISDLSTLNTFGAGSVFIDANGIQLANSAVGGLATDASTPQKGMVTLNAGSGALTLGAGALVRGRELELSADSLSVDATAAIVAGAPTSYTNLNPGFVTIFPFTSSVPMNVAGAPGAGGALNLPTSALDRINPSGWTDGNGDGVISGGAVMFGQTTAPLTVTGELWEPGEFMFINLYGSTVTQTGGSIIHDTLNVNADSINLPENNLVGQFQALAYSGDILFNNAAAALSLGQVNAAGNISISNSQALAIDGLVQSTGGGNVAISAGGDLTQAMQITTSAAGEITVSAANISAGTGTLASTGSGPISYLASGTTTVASSQLVTSGTITVTGTYTGEVVVDTGTGDATTPTAPPPPTVADCTTDPTLAGCETVLPTVTDCTTDPTLEGCTAVLPTVTDCTTDPTLEGCTAVLPTVTDCTTDPTLEGCTAVLPTVTDCTTDPTLEGCTAVLPTVTDCTTDSTLEGCTAVLPTVTDCTTDPTLEGCTAVLPTVTDCTTDPTLEGCTAVLPPITDCTTDPTLEGCAAVLPVSAEGETVVEVVAAVQTLVVVDLAVEAALPVAEPPLPEEPVAQEPSAFTEGEPLAAAEGESNEADDEATEEEEAAEEEGLLAATSEEAPLAQQPIFDLGGGGVAGQNMVCK